MTTKEKIRNGVAKIATESQDIKNDIITFVGDEFKKSIEIKNQTSETIKEITKDTLDGIYEGISDVKNKSQENVDRLIKRGGEIEGVMKESAEAMVNVAKQEGENALAVSKEAAKKAKELFDNASNKAKHSIDNIEDKVKEQMEVTLSDLNETKKEAKSKLEAIGDALKDYAIEKKNKTSEAISNALHKTADKSKETATDLMNLAKSHSKRLTSHSLSKVSDWLKNLSNKVNS
jgi:gas vesicle protein